MKTLNVSLKSNTPAFRCPECDRVDVAYGKMPAFCYWCHHDYLVDFLALEQYREARVHHYYTETTLGEEFYRERVCSSS